MPATPGTHAERVFSGVSWTSASQLVRQCINFMTSIVLARILLPEDFGLVSMATVAVGFVNLFRDLGTSSALIREKEVNAIFLSSLSWINAGIGLTLMLILLVIAPGIAIFFAEPLVSPLMMALAVNLFFSCILSVPLTMMVRELEFDRIAKIDILASLCGALVGVFAAVQGARAWSLVIQSFVATLVTVVMVWRRRRPCWPGKFSWKVIRPVVSYSLNLTGFNIVNYVVRNLDNMIIGKLLGAQNLGYYALAYRLLLLPLQAVSDVAGRVMFPVFSRMQDDLPRLRASYLNMLGKIALITFPMMLGLWAIRDIFVATIYGLQWLPVATLLALFAPLGMIQSIGTTVGLIYQVRGRTDFMLYWSIGTGLLILPAFWFGARHGLLGVAVAYTLAATLLAVPSFWIPCRLIGMRLKDVVAGVAPIFWPALLMTGAVTSIANLMGAAQPSWGYLLLLVASGGVVYLGLLHIMKVSAFQEVLEALRTRLLVSGKYSRRIGDD